MDRALKFEHFAKLNESSSISKKEIGVIGPDLNGEIKIRIQNPGVTLKRIDDGENFVFQIGEKSCSIPKKYVGVSAQPGYDIISFDTNMNWFKSGENEDKFTDIVDEYISAQYGNLGKKMNHIEEDVNVILDLLGIEDDVKSCNQNSQLSFDGVISNGMEFEIEKENEADLFKKMFVYKNLDSIHPLISIKRKGGRYNCFYRTPKGNFECKHDSIDEMLNNPVDKYLLSICLEDTDNSKQRDLVDHLMKLFKYHSWSDKGVSSNTHKNMEEKAEIKRIMNMLKNSIPESHIDEMYTDARSKFLGK